MRRKDRKITDFARICDILDKADFLTLSMLDGDAPYSVPVNFGYQVDGRTNAVQIFIHGAREGKKTDCIQANAAVSFCAVSYSQVGAGEKPCNWTNFYASVCGTGTAVIVEDTDEKKAALTRILAKYGYQGSADFPAIMLRRTGIIRIDVQTLTGKEHARPHGETPSISFVTHHQVRV